MGSEETWSLGSGDVLRFKIGDKSNRSSFEARDHRMSQYLKLFRNLRANFKKVSVVRVPRSQNSHADSLATLASSLDDCIPRMITVELLEQPSIEHQTLVATASELETSWLDPYIAFLSDGSLLMDVKEAEKVQRTSTYFWLSEDKRLYRRSFGGPYLLCLHPSKTTELLIELQEGIYGGHSGVGHSHTEL